VSTLLEPPGVYRAIPTGIRTSMANASQHGQNGHRHDDDRLPLKRRKPLLTAVVNDAGITFNCECRSRKCTETLHIPLGEYVRVRARKHRFLVAPGHDSPRVERVVERHGGYLIVEDKRDAEA
jgi:hypothetical protein